ncbi:hypothetical protein ACFSL6_05680 [Paenibacillus thailandensis]|uniref:Cytosolic protein n=1 Tax=Paenibacillus thailandensis TaxID=393250 RepID=A0ABW5QT73_9BACL
MTRFKEEDRSDYKELSTVESRRNDLAAEEFPDGPYGSDIRSETPGKSTPWRADQRASSAYGYENRELHSRLDRDYDGEDSLTNELPKKSDHP